MNYQKHPSTLYYAKVSERYEKNVFTKKYRKLQNSTTNFRFFRDFCG